MTVYHIAGLADCSRFAQATRAAEILSNNLPTFKFEKEVVPVKAWIHKINDAKLRFNVNHQQSPLIYTDLGKYVGGDEEFFRLIKLFYGTDVITQDVSTLIDSNIHDYLAELKEMEDVHKQFLFSN